MRLADRVAQCRTPFVVRSTRDGSITQLTNAAAFAKDVAICPTRYVLNDELTRLCTALAYSKGASTLACADLLRVPAERVWIEWAEAPWWDQLIRYGFKSPVESVIGGRRGVFIQSTPQGRRGLLRTFWAIGESDVDVMSSNMEAYFDFDTEEGEDPEVYGRPERSSLSVADYSVKGADILRRCFRFRFERTWQDYYGRASLTPEQTAAVHRESLGTIAIEIPVLLAFLLLLITRPGPPHRPLMLERLNKARAKSGKSALLEQIEIFAPLLPEYKSGLSSGSYTFRRPPRLHHVRGHLVRRGSKLFWRVPHLRGSARAGSVRTRTVTWQLDPAPSPSRYSGIQEQASQMS
jgi:hypothetical protein